MTKKIKSLLSSGKYPEFFQQEVQKITFQLPSKVRKLYMEEAKRLNISFDDLVMLTFIGNLADQGKMEMPGGANLYVIYQTIKLKVSKLINE